jgi:hypothetical protein
MCLHDAPVQTLTKDHVARVEISGSSVDSPGLSTWLRQELVALGCFHSSPHPLATNHQLY